MTEPLQIRPHRAPRATGDRRGLKLGRSSSDARKRQDRMHDADQKAQEATLRATHSHPPRPAPIVLVAPPAAAGAAGLATALRDHCRELAAITRLAIHVDTRPVPRLAAERERALLSVVRDVIDQALRSPGTQRIDVGLSASADTVLVLVENRGGDTSRVNHPAGGLGLPNVRAQAAAFGGTVDLLAAHAGGYRVAVTCPVEVEVVV